MIGMLVGRTTLPMAHRKVFGAGTTRTDSDKTVVTLIAKSVLQNLLL
jgi:hypothetical protein